MKEIKLLVFKRRLFAKRSLSVKSDFVFHCRTKSKETTIQIDEFSEKIEELAKKVLIKITEKYPGEEFCFVFTPEGIEEIQTFGNLHGPIKTLEGLSHEDKESFLQNLLTEKSRINAE